MGGTTEGPCKTKKPPALQSGRRRQGGAGGRNNIARSQKEAKPTPVIVESAVDKSQGKQTCDIVQPQDFAAVNVKPSGSDKRGQARDPIPQVMISGRRQVGTTSLVMPNRSLPGASGRSTHVTGGGQDGRGSLDADGNRTDGRRGGCGTGVVAPGTERNLAHLRLKVRRPDYVSRTFTASSKRKVERKSTFTIGEDECFRKIMLDGLVGYCAFVLFGIPCWYFSKCDND